jgi:GDSL-like Lipase/Acylhydrolase family
MKHFVRSAAAVVVLALATSACASTRHDPPAANGATTKAKSKLLTIGGSATEGDGVRDRLRATWPYLVLNEALAPGDELVNGALDGATVANALADQAPLASEVHPTIVAAWLGYDDVLARTPVDAFESAYVALVTAFQNEGARRVLLADVPLSFGGDAQAIDAAIAAVARQTNAELVELSSSEVPVAPTEGLAPQPSTEGQRVVADAFERQLRTRS